MLKVQQKLFCFLNLFSRNTTKACEISTNYIVIFCDRQTQICAGIQSRKYSKHQNVMIIKKFCIMCLIKILPTISQKVKCSPRFIPATFSSFLPPLFNLTLCWLIISFFQHRFQHITLQAVWRWGQKWPHFHWNIFCESGCWPEAQWKGCISIFYSFDPHAGKRHRQKDKLTGLLVQV